MPLRNVATNYTFEQQRQEINLLAADVDSLSTTLTNQQGTETTDSPSFNNLYLGSVIYGPSIFTIDPATHGDNTGTLVVKGNLQIDGTTTTVNSTIMSVNDLNITLADGASNAAAADGAGLTVDGAGATLLYNGSTDEWAFNKSLTSLSVSGISTFNASPLGAANVGVLIDGASGAVVTAATGTNSLFKGFTQGTGTATVNIKANGSTEFSGQLNLGANMQFTAADPELEFNNGGPRFKVPAANTLSIHSGGGLGTTTAERLRITSDGTLESYSPNDTTPNIKFRSDDTNWFGSLNQSTANGTITTFLSTGGDWDASSTTYNCTKALAQYPSTAIAVHNQYNSTWQSDIAFLSKASGSTTTDGAVTELLRILGTGGLKIGNRIIYGSLASDPTGINAGDEYFNTTGGVKKVYDGTSWNAVGSSSSAANIGAAAGTVMYFDFGNYASSSWQGNTSATTLTNIQSSGASGGVNLPRGSSASYNATNGGILRGSGTQDVRATVSGTNPFGTNISMGIVIRFDAGTDNLATPSRGMIYYGNTGDNQHFYVRKNFGGTNTVSMGQDTNGTDVWTAISGTYTSSDGFNVFIFNLASDGTLTCSVNGAAFATVRSGGGAINVTTPNIGFFGDPYNDNSSSFDIGAGFWRTSLTTDTESADWYTYLKSDYGAGSNRFSLT